MGWNIVKGPSIARMQSEPHIYHCCRYIWFDFLAVSWAVLRWPGWQWDDEDDKKPTRHPWVKQMKHCCARIAHDRLTLVQPWFLSPGMVFLFRTMEACSQTASAWPGNDPVRWSGDFWANDLFILEHEGRKGPQDAVLPNFYQMQLFHVVPVCWTEQQNNIEQHLRMRRVSSGAEGGTPWTHWHLWSANLAAAGGCQCRQTPGWTCLGLVSAVVIAREVNYASEMVQPNHNKPSLAKYDIEHSS